VSEIYESVFVGGRWEAAGGDPIDVINPYSERPVARVRLASRADVDRAVEAAQRAQPAWAALAPAARASYLDRISELVRRDNRRLGETICAEVGMPLKTCYSVQAGIPALTFRVAAQVARNFAWSHRLGTSLIHREPIGVIAGVVPWNYPLHQLAAKVAPALAAGNTVVVKPSELTPLNAYLLAEAIARAELPAGVFNLVPGTGAEIGEALCSHPGIDMVSFTGSTRIGRRIAARAGEALRRVSLELGGKSACVILDDADLEAAVRHGVESCYANAGQTCAAQTRMLVPAALLGRAIELARAAAEQFRMGDPRDPETTLGPLISAAQRDRVRAYIQRGLEDGARLVTGGATPPDLPTGYFVRPTVLADVHPDHAIAQEEIFGPVLAIMAHAGDDDAARIANGTVYGLSGAVWSRDPARAAAVARQIRAGQIDINGGAYNPLAPFGGMKQSGHGREFGPFGMEEFLEIKSVQAPAAFALA
jgi:acyl-CoA reductase-like NAD-dependent aldehyde dehydrogenase